MSYRNINRTAWALAAASIIAAVASRLVLPDAHRAASLLSDLLMYAAIAGWYYVHGAHSVLDRIKSIEPTKEMSN